MSLCTPGALIPSNLSAMITNALAQDTRSFYIDDVDSRFTEFNNLCNTELSLPYAMEPTCSVQEIVSHFKVPGAYCLEY